MLSPSHEFITDARELGRRRRNSPIGWKLADFDPLPAQIIRHFRYSQGEIERRIVLIEMNEILEQSEGLVL